MGPRALFGAIVTFFTAGAFAVAGAEMLSIHSIAGNTIAELFYEAMGVFSIAMAGLTVLIALTLDGGLGRVEVTTSAAAPATVATAPPYPPVAGPGQWQCTFVNAQGEPCALVRNHAGQHMTLADVSRAQMG
jgi:hypothetical protein